jgi:hypothetical protein
MSQDLCQERGEARQWCPLLSPTSVDISYEPALGNLKWHRYDFWPSELMASRDNSSCWVLVHKPLLSGAPGPYPHALVGTNC